MDNVTAKEIMTAKVITAKVTDSVQEATKRCVENEVSGLIVVDDQDNVIGVLTEKDLIVAYDFTRETGGTVEDFVTKEVVSVSEDTTLDVINILFVQRNIKRVPVLRDNKAVGVVSRRDVLRCILRQSEAN